MKIVETNAGLGYQEYAYLIELPDKRNLCIYSNEDKGWGNSYKVGEVYDAFDFEGEYDVIPEHKHHLAFKESPLTGTFLFEEFLKTLEGK